MDKSFFFLFFFFCNDGVRPAVDLFWIPVTFEILQDISHEARLSSILFCSHENGRWVDQRHKMIDSLKLSAASPCAFVE